MSWSAVLVPVLALGGPGLLGFGIWLTRRPNNQRIGLPAPLCDRMPVNWRAYEPEVRSSVFMRKQAE